MKLSDFKTNQSFFTATGEWICLDVGTRSVTAIKKSDYNIQEPWDQQDHSKIQIFYSFDFGGCCLTLESKFPIGSPERIKENIASRPLDYQLVDCRDCRGCPHCEPENF